MSIQAECRAAVNRLARQGGVFTEIDVANEAGTDGWSGKMFEQAMSKAYNVLQSEYKAGKLVRYGPVDYNGVKDYARRGSKILYADAHKGPSMLTTPNGNFPRLLSQNDEMAHAGRKAGTNRDDTKPWATQKPMLSPRKTATGPPVDVAPLLRRIEKLEAENNQLRSNGHTNGNGNGNGHNGNGNGHIKPWDESLISELADAIAARMEERVGEMAKNSVAEALIS